MKLRTTPTNGSERSLKLSANGNDEIAAAAERVNVLEASLNAHRIKLGQLGIRTRQCGSDAKQYLGRQAMPRPNMTEPDFDDLAEEVVRAGDVPPRMLMELREAAPVPTFTDTFDVSTVSAFQDERVCIELLTRAVELATRDVRRIRAKVAVQVVREIHPERERVGRRVAAALVELLCAVRAEHHLGATLADQDAGLPALVSPAILSPDVINEGHAYGWIAGAIENGWLSAEQRSHLAALGFAQVPAAV